MHFQWPTPLSFKQTIQLHGQMIVTGSVHQPRSTTHLLKCLTNLPDHSFSLSYALHYFSHIPNPSTFQWNTMIRACVMHQFPKESNHLYHQMHRNGAPPDYYTFQFLFKSFGISASFFEGQVVHGLFIRLFPESFADIANALIHMYVEFDWIKHATRVFEQVCQKDVVSWTTMISGLVKFGSLDEARRLFDVMPHRNVVTWTSMIVGYSKAGRAEEAVSFFKQMLSNNVKADVVAMVSVLSACAQLKDLEMGNWLHHCVMENRIVVSSKLAVALIDMYAKCGDMVSARQIFDSMNSKVPPAWNALIDGYCKMGEVETACNLFDQMCFPDIISYNSMINGYNHSGRLKEALILFRKLRSSGLQPDKFTLVGMLTACASLGALSQGKILHAYVELGLVRPDMFLGTALLDMYSKCGRMDQARLVFSRMGQRDLLAWTAIISGLAMNGMGKQALEQFALMKNEGIRPNSVAYIGVLTACSHSGFLEEGRYFFKEMTSFYTLKPEIEHYGCLLDLLGRCGHLKEAIELIETMPVKPNAVMWGSILSACRLYKDTELAEMATKQIIELEPQEDAAYVQLSNIYMDCKRWSDALKIRRLMEQRGIRKTAGYSSITIEGQVHKFSAGNQLHPDFKEINIMIYDITRRLKLAGYSPNTVQISLDVDDEEKEQALYFHSEKMAIAFGIMKLPSNVLIHVMKNLRVCEDCHAAIKLISNIWNREIIVRDRSRFHHFKDGLCSCNDFW